MAIDTLFLIPCSGIQNGSMRKHRPAFVGDVKNIAMAFLALVIRERGICLSSLQFMVVFTHVLGKMNEDILHAVCSFSIEKIECVMGGW